MNDIILNALERIKGSIKNFEMPDRKYIAILELIAEIEDIINE